jgi:hypothetical protein
MTFTEIKFDDTFVFPKAPKGSKIKVFYLEATLALIQDNLPTKNNIVSINTYHSALGFIYEDGTEFVIELVAKEILRTQFPNQIELKNNNIVWENQTQVNYYPSIDRNYWKFSTYICEIEPSIFPLMKKFILDSFMPNNQMYVMWSVIRSPETYSSPILRNCICDTLPFAIIEFFKENGVLIAFVTPIFVGASGIITDKDVKKLDEKNQIDKTKIITFYKNVAVQFNDLMNKIETIKKSIKKPGDKPGDKSFASEYTVATEIMEVLKKFGTIIVYTYDKDNRPAYFEVENKGILLDYIENKNITRNVYAKDIDGNIVKDVYTDNLIEPIVYRASALKIFVWLAAGILTPIVIIIMMRKHKRT